MDMWLKRDDSYSNTELKVYTNLRFYHVNGRAGMIKLFQPGSCLRNL